MYKRQDITSSSIEDSCKSEILLNSLEFVLKVVMYLSISNFVRDILTYYSVISRSSKSPQLTVKNLAGISSFGLPTGKFFG